MPGRAQTAAQQWLAAGLSVCLSAAALAFGGTEPLTWAAVELLAFALFAWVLWSAGAPLPWIGPVVLLGYAIAHTAMVRADLHAARNEILRLATCLCVFYTALAVARSEKPRLRLLQGSLALGVFEALYGLIQYASGWQQIFTYKKVFYTQAATGTYINPNHFAGLLEAILPCALAWTLHSFDRTAARPGRRLSLARVLQGEGLPRLAFFSFCTVLLFVAILFSRSRAGILSATAGVLVVSAAWFLGARRGAAAAMVLASVLVGAAIFLFWFGPGPVLERFEGASRDFPSRVQAWRDALELVREHPFGGNGLGSFVGVYTRVQTIAPSATVDHAHNDYLELAVEWGLPGAALVVGIFLLVIARAFPACTRAPNSSAQLAALGCCGGILALLLHSIVDFNLQIPANALVFAALLGVAWAAGESVTQPRAMAAAASRGA